MGQATDGPPVSAGGPDDKADLASAPLAVAPLVRSVVGYVDRDGRTWPALVTAVWRESYDPEDPRPTLNLVLVSPDPARFDPYGRQIERRVAVAHQSRSPAGAPRWRLDGEAPLAASAVLTH